jgi:hypothetical protein
MKIVQVVPKPGADVALKRLLNAKERELRGRSTLRREKPGLWTHVAYPGRIRWDAGAGGILLAEIRAGAGPDWQLTNSFVGYLDRHLGPHIESITIQYRDEAPPRRSAPRARGSRASAGGRSRPSRAGRGSPARRATRGRARPSRAGGRSRSSRAGGRSPARRASRAQARPTRAGGRSSGRRTTRRR